MILPLPAGEGRGEGESFERDCNSLFVIAHSLKLSSYSLAVQLFVFFAVAPASSSCNETNTAAHSPRAGQNASRQSAVISFRSLAVSENIASATPAPPTRLPGTPNQI